MKQKDYDYLKSASAQDCTGLIPAKAKCGAPTASKLHGVFFK